MGKKGTPHRRYSKDEKMKYVRLHLDEHMSLTQIEKEYGIRNSLVGAWVKKYLEDGEDALEAFISFIDQKHAEMVEGSNSKYNRSPLKDCKYCEYRAICINNLISSDGEADDNE